MLTFNDFRWRFMPLLSSLHDYEGRTHIKHDISARIVRENAGVLFCQEHHADDDAIYCEYNDSIH